MLRSLTFIALPQLVTSQCPAGGHTSGQAKPAGHPNAVPDEDFTYPLDPKLYPNRVELTDPVDKKAFAAALAKIDFGKVKKDIKALLVDSKDFWPADFGNYGPFFIRLAWHCSGSYRQSDGRGGCDGARIRFDPERSWPDNGNLDKARLLLSPIKKKYGEGLSWGDLIILTGNTAIESMGGSVLGFCAGRVDAHDATESVYLGPTKEQKELYDCAVQGDCKAPLGQTTLGLIYVNPEGPMAKPDPKGSVVNIRDSFGRMEMNDTETVALIGGGHAIGKTHGACTNATGPAPNKCPSAPWYGYCGTGKGADAVTSGFEVQFTTDSTKYDNEYFKYLLDYEDKWEVFVGPGGHHQWRVKNATGKVAKIGRLTSDIALLHDDKYKDIVKDFAQDNGKFETAFAHAWYKLTTRDMGPVTRCFGSDVPAAQPWQNPLPAALNKLPDFDAVRQDPTFHKIVVARKNRELFFRLAYRCAATFRITDYRGGCNGARIRHSPEKNWKVNTGLDKALKLLEPIKRQFEDDGLSWADLIVLAGTEAANDYFRAKMPFCGGRTDAEDGSGSASLEPQDISSANQMKIMGVQGEVHQALLEGGGSLDKAWQRLGWQRLDKGLTKAWLELVNADRFDGPTGSACEVHVELKFQQHQKSIALVTGSGAPLFAWITGAVALVGIVGAMARMVGVRQARDEERPFAEEGDAEMLE